MKELTHGHSRAYAINAAKQLEANSCRLLHV
jgi:hypothetical protein